MKLVYSLLVLLLSAQLSGCGPARTPIPIGEIPPQFELTRQDEEFGRKVFEQLAKKYRVSNDDAAIRRVRAVADRLTSAARVDHNPWHVYVFEDDSFENAAATRGNHVFVWTGLLRKVRNDDELATVLSHEIAHVLAGHTNPNPNEEARQIASGLGGSIAGHIIASQGGAPIVADLAQLALREALQAFLVNPEAQRMELEADQVGLFLMADAGYDPRDALGFWERMKDAPGFSGLPVQFLSSHPSSTERIEQLRYLLPEAEDRFVDSRRFGRSGDDRVADSFDFRRRRGR